MAEHSQHGVSVIVPTLQRGDFLADCLRDLAAQTHERLEVVIVDQSDSVPPQVAEALKLLGDRASHYRVNFRGLPSARNFGWQFAKHDRLIFVDDDVRMPPDFVTRHLDALSTPGVGIVAGGFDEPKRGHDAGPNTGRFFRHTCDPHRGFAATGRFEVDHAQGCNFSTFKSVLQRVGGFDETLNYGAALYEDLDFALRVGRTGLKVLFDGAARLTHLVAPSGGCRVDQVARYTHSLGHNRSLVISRHLAPAEQATAYAYLLKLFAAYAVHYRNPAAIAEGWSGLQLGRRAGQRAPLCTSFGPQHLQPAT
jgi:GT2 family glycosyltransferase